jgi:hypothetical protein
MSPIFRAAADAAGWGLGFLGGGVWGMAIFSWGLPFPLPVRFAATGILIAAMAAASPAGRLAAGAFALGIGTSTALLLASAGQLLSDWWGLVPGVALAAGLGLTADRLLRSTGDGDQGGHSVTFGGSGKEKGGVDLL